MAKVSLFSKRFSELEAQFSDVETTRRYGQGEYSRDEYVDSNLLLNWATKVQHLLSSVCGKDSIHYRNFEDAGKGSMYETNYQIFQKLKAIFLAAREDYEGGYLTSVRNIVQAEVFDDELDQARELLSGGYVVASAVIAGVVLETTLRQLCVDAGIPAGKLDKMNADLVKAGTYNVLTQKRITAMADIRNSAAHGHPEKFTQADVSDMISSVERFVSERL